MVILAQDAVQDSENRGSDGERIRSSGEEYDERPTFLRTP